MKKHAPLSADVRLDRVADDLWRLVNIPSPTGTERAILTTYARLLADAGAKVSLHGSAVVGRLKGNRPGGTFQLAGHADHIDVPHPAPTRTARIVSGRGAADMKAGLAGILEVVRVLKLSGCDFPGQILVTVYGLHEAPAGDSSALRALIERGITGDAALVAETSGPANQAVVAAAGQSIWTVTLRWKGKACHELNRPAQADGLRVSLVKVLGALDAKARQLARRAGSCPLLRPESLFIGQVHMGDFYNRTPLTATIQGTRRWHPVRDFAAVRRDMQALLSSVRLAPQVQARLDWTFVGEAYELDQDEPVLKAYQAACKTVTGRRPRLGGTMAICDGARLVPLGGVPTVLCGFDNETAHADREYVRLARLAAPCRIALLTAMNFLRHSEDHA
jgi:acetylornithine deacetylase/succinyl-diaminopimelate desuccinylase-like protein